MSPTHALTYGAVQGGLHAFADALRRQFAPKSTHVLELMPAMTDTPMNPGATERRVLRRHCGHTCHRPHLLFCLLYGLRPKLREQSPRSVSMALLTVSGSSMQ